MIGMSKHPRSLARQSGQGMSEYIIITAVIAVAAIGTFGYFGQAIESQTAGMAKSITGEDASSAESNANDASSSAESAASNENTMDSYNSDDNNQTGS